MPPLSAGVSGYRPETTYSISSDAASDHQVSRGAIKVHIGSAAVFLQSTSLPNKCLLRWVSMGRLISKFLHHVLPGVVRPLHVLWNEIIGFLFLVLAAMAVPSLIRTVRAFEGDAEGLFRIVLTVLFALVMVYFGVASFLRARKISRS
jgi:hypothetical protein